MGDTDEFADIAQWLRTNQVEFESARFTPCYQYDFEFIHERHFRNLLKSYIDLHDTCTNISGKNFVFPHKRELTFLVDRRGQPHDHVYVYSSSKCRFRGRCTLSLSFEVQESDRICARLSWNNQTIRFLPRNLKSIFSSIFDMDWNRAAEELTQPSENERFLKQRDLSDLIHDMEACIKDQRLDSFLAWLDVNNQYPPTVERCDATYDRSPITFCPPRGIDSVERRLEATWQLASTTVYFYYLFQFQSLLS